MLTFRKQKNHRQMPRLFMRDEWEATLANGSSHICVRITQYHADTTPEAIAKPYDLTVNICDNRTTLGTYGEIYRKRYVASDVNDVKERAREVILDMLLTRGTDMMIEKHEGLEVIAEGKWVDGKFVMDFKKGLNA